MKTIAALIAGLLLSVATFLGGVMTGSIFVGATATNLTPQNTDTASLWTSQPMVVDRERQVLTRLPSRQQPNAATVATVNKTGVGGSMPNSTDGKPEVATANAQAVVDPMIAGAIDPAQKADPNLQQAHVQWCSRRYASYRAADNTYKPYGAPRRTCLSPDSDMAVTESTYGRDVSGLQQPSETSANDNQAQVQAASYDEAAGEPVGVGDDAHVKSCLSRYRSYNAGDNSYQPYDGGPRRQCR